MKTRIVVLLLSGLMAFNVMASSSLTAERKRFTAVLPLLKAGNFSSLSSAKDELADYPLLPYLDYYALSLSARYHSTGVKCSVLLPNIHKVIWPAV